jgi:Uma2 family endonuclease
VKADIDAKRENPEHESAPWTLAALRKRWNSEKGELALELPDGTHSAPDISYWTAPRHPEDRHGAVNVVPDLAVEVLSPRTRANDLGAKRDAYLRAGARELWLVDPPARTVTRVHPDAGEALLTGNERLQSTLLPGFSHKPGRPRPLQRHAGLVFRNSRRFR